jgi:glycosyltransferase involved in cell wall biosynthesis
VVAADLIETRRTAAEAAMYVPDGTPEQFAHAINALLEDQARREAMRSLGLRRFAEMLSWEHQATAYLGVWNRLLGRRAPASIPAQRAAADAAHEGVSRLAGE